MPPAEAIIFDLEFTTWEGAMARQWSGPGEYREIVQIGAVRVNALDLTIVDELDILVRPTKNPVLSQYFIELTGIQQEQVNEKGLAFSAALARFQEFRRDLSLWAYGNDSDIFSENMLLNNMLVPDDWPAGHASNLSPWFHAHAPETRGINSGRLVEALGLRSKLAEHTGLGDCHSIIESIKFITKNKGFPQPLLISR